MSEYQKETYLIISNNEYRSLKKEYLKTGICNTKPLL